MGLSPEIEVNDFSFTPMTSSFFASELKQALAEQSFGISGCRLGISTSHEARATVDLLEGVHIDVRLNVQGYELCGTSSALSVALGSVFESLDALLNEASPGYRAKRVDLLFARLSS